MDKHNQPKNLIFNIQKLVKNNPKVPHDSERLHNVIWIIDIIKSIMLFKLENLYKNFSRIKEQYI
jgi:hypothetical protein